MPWAGTTAAASRTSIRFSGVEPGHVLHALSRCGMRRTRAKRAAKIHHQSRLVGRIRQAAVDIKITARTNHAKLQKIDIQGLPRPREEALHQKPFCSPSANANGTAT